MDSSKFSIFKMTTKSRQFKMNSKEKKTKSEGSKLVVRDRYIIKSLMFQDSGYRVYKGIDQQLKKYVSIYVKPASKEKFICKKIPIEERKKISPMPIQTFTTEINTNMFDFEIHEKYGPSLKKICSHFKKKISDKTLYVLAYQLLKLLKKVDALGMVVRNLDPDIILCHNLPEKTELFLLNTFSFERKNTSLPPLATKYCSVGAHLGLKSSSKDTFEAMCYVLMDIYLNGKLFSQKEKKYENAKIVLEPKKIPKTFQTFYYYVKNLNPKEEIKFDEWKNIFKRQLSEQDLLRPYEWNDAQSAWVFMQSKLTGFKTRIEEKAKEEKKQMFFEEGEILGQQNTALNKQDFESDEEDGYDENEFEEFDEKQSQKMKETVKKCEFQRLIHKRSL